MENTKQAQRQRYTEAFDFLLDGDHELVVYGVLKKLHITKTNPYYDDMVQEGRIAFINKYLQALNAGKPEKEILPFIYQGVKWALLDYLRKQLTTVEHVQVPEDNVDPLAELIDPLHTVENIDTGVLIRRLGTVCTKQQMQYMILAFEWGLTITEIANQLNVTRPTVYQLRKAVIKKIGKLF